MPRSGGGRPAVYKTKDGRRVVGVTTITSRFKDSAALVRWAFNVGREGGDIDESRDAAAAAGHAGHAAIDALIHERPTPECPPEHAAAVASCVASFQAWREQTKVEIIETETALISERYRFGGTFDWLLKIDGKLWLGDIKTGNRVYPEMLAQMGGYAVLLEERGDIVEGVVLLRLGKEHADWHAHTWPRAVLDLGIESFLGMRRLYDLDASLKKAVG